MTSLQWPTASLSLVLNIQLVFCFAHSRDSNGVALEDILGEQPIFAHVLFRHGDRNLHTPYPNDPYGNKNERLWPGGFEALTELGKLQSYELGKYIRRRYKHLINKNYSSNEVYIRSSNTNRTLTTAKYAAVGIFSTSVKFHIPVHTVSKRKDYLLYPLAQCSRFDFLFDQFMQSPELEAKLRQFKPFIEYIGVNAGYDNVTLKDIVLFYDTLFIEKLKGLTLPVWANAVMNDTLKHLAVLYYEAFTHTTEMKKIQAGFLIKEILDRFTNKSLSLLQPDRKLWIYSAHDLTIVNILNALNVFDDHLPPFVSSLYFELYRYETEFYVQLYYRRTSAEKFPALVIPGCGIFCPLKQFYEIYKDILPTENHATLCKM